MLAASPPTKVVEVIIIIIINYNNCCVQRVIIDERHVPVSNPVLLQTLIDVEWWGELQNTIDIMNTKNESYDTRNTIKKDVQN